MKKQNSVYFLLAVLLICTIVVGWSLFRRAKAGSGIRNVLLISIDTCRADYFSCYGHPRPTTPNIDKVAQEGVLFANAVSPIPFTLPAHSSMLTGTIPPYHGVHDNTDYRLEDSNITLAEILGEKGFATGAFISAFIIDSQFGLNQGFDTYNDKFEEELSSIGINERRAEETSSLAMNWLGEHKAEQFFLFLHYYDAHMSYDPPEPFATKFADNIYAGEIAYADYWIGHVFNKLKELGLYDSTLIIVTADHGEMLTQHKEVTHGYFVYEGNVHVPLIIKVPGQKKPRRIEQRVGIIDILPTVCGLLDIESPPGIQGKDLSNFLFGRGAEDERYVFCQSLQPTKYNANSLLAVVNDRYKYIQTTRPELYDLIEDPQEKNNLIELHPQRARILQEQLRKILEQSVRKTGADGKAMLDEDALKRLESLGYVGGGVDTDFSFNQTKDDPKDLIEFHVTYSKVNGIITAENYEKAEEVCFDLLSQNPDFAQVHILFARIDAEQDAPEKAYSHLQDALKLEPERYDFHKRIGAVLLKLEKYDDAIEHYKEALRLGTEMLDVLDNLGSLFVEKKQPAKALPYLKRALEIDPDYYKAHLHMGMALTDLNEIAPAIEHLNKMLSFDPKVKMRNKALNHLGLAYMRTGRRELAAEYFRQALEGDPNFSQANKNMGAILFEQGKRQEAIGYFQKAVEIEPDDPGNLKNLGLALIQQGKVKESMEYFNKLLGLKLKNSEMLFDIGVALVSKQEYELAAAYCAKAKELFPNMPKVYIYAGNLLFQRGKADEAIKHFETLIYLWPSQPQLYNDFGSILARQKKLDAAVGKFQKAIELDPKYTDARLNHAFALTQQGQTDQAIEQYNQLLELDAKNPQFYNNLGSLQASKGNFKEAVNNWTKSLDVIPDQVGVLNSLAWLKATCADDKLLDPQAAVQLAVKACELTDFKQAQAMDTLAAAYAAAGNFDEAIKTSQKALDIVRAAGQNNIVEIIEKHLKLYRSGRPYREPSRSKENVDK